MSTWNKRLEIGVKEIDNQHKTLCDNVDKLLEAGKQHKSKEYVVEIFNFLDNYAKTHFRDEERYMLKIGYPRYSEQKRMHDSFIQKLKELRTQYENEGANISVIIGANKFVLDWLTKHITLEDKKIGEFERSNK